MLNLFASMSLGGEQQGAASSAAAPRKKRGPKQKRKLTPAWTTYINEVWRPQQRAGLAEATNLNALHQIEDSIKSGINAPAYDFANDVALDRAKAFFTWLQSEGVQHDDGNEGSTGHWPKEWQGVTSHLEAERARQILRAKSSSKGARRGAIKGLLEGGTSLSQLNAMGISTRGLKGL